MRAKRNSGFSLIELIVTIAIVAILLAVAFPSFQGSLRSNRVATGTNELMASLSLARSEALRNPGGAVMCTSASGTACNGAWADGWIVGLDVDGATNCEISDPVRVVRRVVGNPKLVLAATAAPLSAASCMRFDGRGRLRDGLVRSFVLVPDTCPANVELRRNLRVMPTGQVQMDKVACP